ncbi:mating pheromone precursor bbp2-4 [Schizophyllum amplum]|uniref:Mating pheromone bbp2-4 n=1 Tax=Schizophyllum amplum TaxID=97359 RepID=A0A550C0S5_9AGAR|nr:mating pheromone precursor bbp2-4 [Auriculariopsis ampla]
MDTFTTLECLAETAPVQEAAPSVTPSEPSASEGFDDFLRMVADSDSPCGYFGGYCVVA